MSLTKVPNSMQSSAPVSVKDFGAVGDGVTDDTAAIQAAIDSFSPDTGNGSASVNRGVKTGGYTSGTATVRLGAEAKYALT